MKQHAIRVFAYAGLAACVAAMLVTGCSQPINCGTNGTYDPRLQACTFPPPDADAGAADASGDRAMAADGGIDVPSTDVGADGSVASDVPINHSLAAPRQIAPMSTSIATSQTPTFHWSLVNGIDGAAVDVCKDRTFMTQCQTIRVTGTSGQPTTPLAAGVWFWHARGRMGMTEGTQASATWEVFVRGMSALNDTSWGTIPDFNGDGIADIVVGAPSATTADAGSRGPGSISVFNGAAGGISATPTNTLLNPLAMGAWGGVTANAGDVNGDGFADIVAVVGGEAIFIAGGLNGFGNSPSGMIMPHGSNNTQITVLAATAAGDVNGDGYGDVIVTSSTPSLGADAAVTTTYAVGVYMGSSGGITTQSSTVSLNSSVSLVERARALAAGDFNGDGYGDVAVSWVFPATPQVCIFNGSSNGIQSSCSAPLTPPMTGQSFGSVVADGGDLNGDGYADLILGPDTLTPCSLQPNGGTLCFPGTAGSTLVYYGHSTGVHSAPDVTLTNPAGSGSGTGSFGETAAAGGDVDGDGYDDLLVTATFGASEAMGLYLFEGGSNGVVNTPSLTLTLPMAGCTLAMGCFPIAARGADVNGDGFVDVLFSAADWGAWLYYGSASGVPISASVMLTGSADFGASVL